MSEDGWFPKTVDNAVVALNMMEKTRSLLQRVEELRAQEAGVSVPQPIDVDDIFSAFTIDSGRRSAQESQHIFKVDGWVQNTVTGAFQLKDPVNSPVEFGIIRIGAQAAQSVTVLFGLSWKAESHGNIELLVYIFNKSLDRAIFTQHWVEVGERVRPQPNLPSVPQLRFLLSLNPVMTAETFTDSTIPVIKGNT